MSFLQRETILDVLLNTLEAERYMRGPLLVDLIHELKRYPSLTLASAAAQDLLSRLERDEVTRPGFVAEIGALRTLVEARSVSGTTPEVPRSTRSAA